MESRCILSFLFTQGPLPAVLRMAEKVNPLHLVFGLCAAQLELLVDIGPFRSVTASPQSIACPNIHVPGTEERGVSRCSQYFVTQVFDKNPNASASSGHSNVNQVISHDVALPRSMPLLATKGE